MDIQGALSKLFIHVVILEHMNLGGKSGKSKREGIGRDGMG